MPHGVRHPFIAIACGVLLLYVAISGLRTGAYQDRGSRSYARKKHPFTFWFNYAVILAVAVALIAWGVFQTF
jgi:hypothetical protein